MLIFRDNDYVNIRNINPGDIGYTNFTKTFWIVEFYKLFSFFNYTVLKLLKSILYSTLSINYDGNVQRLPNSNNTSSTWYIIIRDNNSIFNLFTAYKTTIGQSRAAPLSDHDRLLVTFYYENR